MTVSPLRVTALPDSFPSFRVLCGSRTVLGCDVPDVRPSDREIRAVLSPVSAPPLRTAEPTVLRRFSETLS